MNVLGKVTWELSTGVRSLRTLCQMLHQVGAVIAAPAELDGDRDHIGVFLAGRRYWVGINFDWPEILYFGTEETTVDPAAAEQLRVEGVYEWKDAPGHGWHRKLNLESEEVHFYARMKASQLTLLEVFIRECVETVRRIEVRGPNHSGPQSPPLSL